MKNLAYACITIAVLVFPAAAAAQTASLNADFQPVVDGTITIAEVDMPADGFLVVRLPKDNKPFYGDVLAAVPLKAGRHTDVAVRLEPAAKTGDTLGIVLHQDDTTIGTYEFELGKEIDLPFFDGKRPVVEVIGIID